MKLIVAILCLSLPLVAGGQRSASDSSFAPAENRVQGVLKSLESDNTLRLALERGDRGDGIHHSWMDGMKRYGIRQASFVIGFKWNDGVRALKIREASYLRHYYRYDSRVRDRDLLRQVNESGLGRELRDAVLARARADVPRIMENVRQTAGARPSKAHGTLYLNLLDDEALPILDEMPNVEW
jgi:hypothetical protein